MCQTGPYLKPDVDELFDVENLCDRYVSDPDANYVPKYLDAFQIDGTNTAKDCERMPRSLFTCLGLEKNNTCHSTGKYIIQQGYGESAPGHRLIHTF